MEIVYESDVQWDPERPDTLIITCVDGRLVSPLPGVCARAPRGRRANRLRGGARRHRAHDPVGPRAKDFNFFRRRITSVIEAHGIERIVAIAHQDCAWYRAQLPRSPAIDLKRCQIADLRRGASLLREMFAGVTVETYFAHLTETSQKRCASKRRSSYPTNDLVNRPHYAPEVGGPFMKAMTSAKIRLASTSSSPRRWTRLGSAYPLRCRLSGPGKQRSRPARSSSLPASKTPLTPSSTST